MRSTLGMHEGAAAPSYANPQRRHVRREERLQAASDIIWSVPVGRARNDGFPFPFRCKYATADLQLRPVDNPLSTGRQRPFSLCFCFSPAKRATGMPSPGMLMARCRLHTGKPFGDSGALPFLCTASRLRRHSVCPSRTDARLVPCGRIKPPSVRSAATQSRTAAASHGRSQLPRCGHPYRPPARHGKPQAPCR